jgi:hypothetical protein
METSSTEKAKPKMRRRKKILLVIVALLVLLLGWIGFDLFIPRKTKMREFDANEVARLETGMWRSYYDRKRLGLFLELGQALRTQYKMPFWKSNYAAFQAAKAAFVFKDGKARADYEKALPNLVKFYQSVRSMSDIDFDVESAARLELEWWIIHREREKQPAGSLERSLADLQSELYRVPPDALKEHAKYRAEAMKIRDTKAEAGGVTEEDWKKIDELLRLSWQSLHKAVNP